MGCCSGDREKLPEVNAQQKWEYINLDDFKSKSCWTPFAYGYLYLMLFVSTSIYALDTFTAINLLVFDKWAGQVQPAIPLSISRWIFAGCIIASFVLLFYRWLRAIRVMRQSGVASSYLDPLAVRIQSARMGKEGRGWKRFLVFAELTKSRKGADYVALFAHYTFEAWLRIIFAEGPRQAINALTLWAVLQAKLIPKGPNAPKDGNSPVGQFFVNVAALAQANKEQSVVLCSMLWTLTLWVFSMVSLICAMTLYLLFLWHHIPSHDGGLSGYCRRKINKRLQRIVKAKVDKALEQENAIRIRQAARDGLDFKRQPTLPDLGTGSSDSLPALSRQTTMTTLPEYSSRPGTRRQSDGSLESQVPTLPKLDPDRRPLPPGRTNTQSSWNSYRSDAPLMNEASEMGYAPPSRAPTLSSMALEGSRPPPGRSMTGMSQSTQRSASSGPRPGPGYSGRNTPGSYQMEPLPAGSQGRRTPSDQNRPYPPSARSQTPQGVPYPRRQPSSDDAQGRTPATTTNPYFPPVRSQTPQGAPYPRRQQSSDESPAFHTPTTTTNPYFSPIEGPNGRNSPAPTQRSHTPGGAPSMRSYTPVGLPPSNSFAASGHQPPLPRSQTPSSANGNSGGYMAFSPNALSSTPTSAPPPNGQYRSASAPRPNFPGRAPPQSAYPARSGSVPPERRDDVTGDILDSY